MRAYPFSPFRDSSSPQRSAIVVWEGLSNHAARGQVKSYTVQIFEIFANGTRSSDPVTVSVDPQMCEYSGYHFHCTNNSDLCTYHYRSLLTDTNTSLQITQNKDLRRVAANDTIYTVQRFVVTNRISFPLQAGKGYAVQVGL